MKHYKINAIGPQVQLGKRGPTLDKSRIPKIIDVTAYAVDNTGSTDVTGILETLSQSNTTLYFPAGLYTVGDCFMENVGIIGEGVFQKEENAEFCFVLGDNVHIDGVGFNSAPSTGQRAEIQLGDQTENITIKSCKFTGSLYAAIRADVNGTDDSSLTFTGPAARVKLLENTFEGYSRPLYLHNVYELTIKGNTFADCSRDAIRLRQRTGKCIIEGNMFLNIGQESSFVERPQNWLSTISYSSGDIVAIPEFGKIYQANQTTTIGANPETTGSSEWTVIDTSYFETKDAIDAYWSGVELIIANNIIDKTAGFGFDLKGSNPEGTYTTSKIICVNNIIKNTFGTGINLSSADLDASGKFHYAGEFIINSNYLSGCNRERFDLAQSPITVRHGVRNAIISGNIVEKNFARGITIANIDENALISKGISVHSNRVVSNGIPGHPSNIGLNISPVDGLIVDGNVCRNHDRIEEYKLSVSGTANADHTLTIPTRGNIADIDASILNGDMAYDILSKLQARLTSNDFLVPYETVDASYYDNVRLEQINEVLATGIDGSGQVEFTYKTAAAAGNDKTVTITVDNIAVTSVYPTADHFTMDANENLSIKVRSSTKPEHFLLSWNSNASAAIKAAWDTALTSGTPSDAASQIAMGSSTIDMDGGIDGQTYLYFDARLEEALTIGDTTANGYTLSIERQNFHSNSVQKYAASIKDYEIVGSKTFYAPKLSFLILNNVFDGNSDNPRYNVLFNNVELPSLIAYVDSDNTANTATITATERTRFTGGIDANIDTHLNAQASLTVQGIVLKARNFGVKGNGISFKIEQQTGNDKTLSVLIAPQIFGGSEIKLLLPTDSSGNPVAVTVAAAEEELKRRLGQGIMRFENNYYGNGLPMQTEQNNYKNVSLVSTFEGSAESVQSSVALENPIPFDTDSDPGSFWNGSQFSVNEDMEISLEGSVDLGTSDSCDLYAYITYPDTSTKRKIINAGLTSQRQPFSAKLFAPAGSLVDIRASKAYTYGNNALSHHISIVARPLSGEL